MTDDELGKAYFEYTNRGWPEPNKMRWEQLPNGTKYLWIQRAKKKGKQESELADDIASAILAAAQPQAAAPCPTKE